MKTIYLVQDPFFELLVHLDVGERVSRSQGGYLFHDICTPCRTQVESFRTLDIVTITQFEGYHFCTECLAKVENEYKTWDIAEHEHEWDHDSDSPFHQCEVCSEVRTCECGIP